MCPIQGRVLLSYLAQSNGLHQFKALDTLTACENVLPICFTLYLNQVYSDVEGKLRTFCLPVHTNCPPAQLLKKKSLDMCGSQWPQSAKFYGCFHLTYM